jgi:hypothetical protein
MLHCFDVACCFWLKVTFRIYPNLRVRFKKVHGFLSFSSWKLRGFLRFPRFFHDTFLKHYNDITVDNIRYNDPVVYLHLKIKSIPKSCIHYQTFEIYTKIFIELKTSYHRFDLQFSPHNPRRPCSVPNTPHANLRLRSCTMQFIPFWRKSTSRPQNSRWQKSVTSVETSKSSRISREGQYWVICNTIFLTRAEN